MVADTSAGYRVCETASPPTYYLPPQAVDRALLRRSSGACEPQPGLERGAGGPFNCSLQLAALLCGATLL